MMNFLLAATLLVFIFTVLWYRTKLTQKMFGHRVKDTAAEEERCCKLELPENFDISKARKIDFFFAFEKTGDTVKFTEMPDVYLILDCIPGQIIPILYRGTGILTELIISRKTGDEKEKDYIKKDCAYLFVSSNKKVVSRPKKNRYGHARIFPGGEKKYSIEDLNSKVGTFLNENSIAGADPHILQDGDVIDIGGKNGITIIYKDSRDTA